MDTPSSSSLGENEVAVKGLRTQACEAGGGGWAEDARTCRAGRGARRAHGRSHKRADSPLQVLENDAAV